MKLQEALQKWLNEHQLSRPHVVSLAYVPPRTLEEVLTGERRIPALQRLYLLTGITEFMPTADELGRDEIPGREAKNKIDLAIATFFIERWKRDGMLPDAGDALQIGKLKKDKNVHSQVLLRKYFRLEKGEYVPNDTPSSSHSNVVITDPYELIINTLKVLTDGTTDQQKKYMKENEKKLKSLSGFLNVLMKYKDPSEGFKQLKLVINFSFTS